jgi:hypothetical protein
MAESYAIRAMCLWTLSFHGKNIMKRTTGRPVGKICVGDAKRMRKIYHRKARSCPLCKPHKMAKEKRWTHTELDRLRRDEKMCREATGKNDATVA